MKNLVTRFGMLAVLGSLVCGLMVAGCGGGAEEDTTTNTTTNTTTTAPDAGDGS